MLFSIERILNKPEQRKGRRPFTPVCFPAPVLPGPLLGTIEFCLLLLAECSVTRCLIRVIRSECRQLAAAVSMPHVNCSDEPRIVWML